MIGRTVALLGLLLLPASVVAQSPDSGAPLRGRALRRDIKLSVDSARRQVVEDRLRQAIRERFTQRVAQELALDSVQVMKLDASMRQFAARRAELDSSASDLRRSLRRQLRPGVAADDDAVARLTDELTALQLRRAQLQQDQLKDLSGFLTPVQRAKYLAMQQRLRQLVEEAAARARARARNHSSPE